MRATSLGSGSSGNAYLIEAGPGGRTRLLVDAGFPARILNERLRQVGCAPHLLRGALVTHEHSDHILGLPFLLKYHQVPVYADPRTLNEIRAIFSAGELRSESGLLVSFDADFLAEQADGAGSFARVESMRTDERVEGVQTEHQPVLLFPADEAPATDLAAASVQAEHLPARFFPADKEPLSVPAAGSAQSSTLWRSLPVGTSCVIGDIEVRSFPVSHDAIAPCGYVLSAGGCRVCIITDSGEVTPVMLEALALADLLILESNHDRERLLSGPYPIYLKQRILSPTGHLSNTQAAAAVLGTWRSDAVRWLWLAHLSRTNNTRKLALTSMQQSLRQAGANPAQLHISVLSHEVGQESWDSARLWRDEHLWKMP